MRSVPLAFHLLKHFKPDEFGDGAPFMHESVLLALDAFRSAWGAPVVVSPHPAATARFLGPDSMSGHNVDRWGASLAVDVFPQGMNDRRDMARAVACAITSEATGIGLYTDTQPGYMLHIDTRPDRTPNNPRLWSRVDGKYGLIGDVL